MAWPLATKDPDPVLSDLSDRYQHARKAAADAWATFERARDAAAKTGARDGSPEFKAAEEAHGAYKKVAARAGSLQEELEDALVKRAGGGAPRGPGGWPTGLGKDFLEGVGAKALDGTSGGTMVRPFYDPRIRDLPQRNLFMRSFIPVRPAGGDRVQYLRQTVADHQAAPVAAHAVKPTSGYTVEKVETPVRVIAHVTEALDRSLITDVDGLQMFIDGQLRLGVLLAEEDQILNGDGEGANLEGILNTSGINAVTRGAEESVVDAIYRGVTAIRLEFMEPEAIVLHPNDWESIRLERDADGELLSAPVVEADPERLWGYPVIHSKVIAEGTGLVANFSLGATVWDRESARVTFAETGLSDVAGEEMFTKNELRWRGEERIAFGVERPAAFTEVTLQS